MVCYHSRGRSQARRDFEQFLAGLTGRDRGLTPVRRNTSRTRQGTGGIGRLGPELLAGTHYYARLFPGPDGKMAEESDRYAQAILYAKVARKLFQEASSAA